MNVETIRTTSEIVRDIYDLTDELNAALLRERGDELLSCAQAAAVLNVSATTISNYLRQGLLTKVIREGRTGILRSQVHALARSKRHSKKQ